MTILITGGTGFIGSRLALACLARGNRVRLLGQENTPAEAENRALLESKGAEVLLGSVTDRDVVVGAMPEVELVYHLAAAQHEVNVPDQHFWDVNVTGTRHVLEASVRAGVKRLVHGSTIGVYGDAGGECIGESSPIRPTSIYGITKLAGERLAQSFGDRLAVVIVRISEAYGPGDQRLLKLFWATRKGRLVMIGNGANLHHLIYIEDLVDGLLLAGTVPQIPGQPIVLAGAEPVTSRELLERIAEQCGGRIPAAHLPLRSAYAAATALETLLRPLRIQPPVHRRSLDFFRKSFRFSGRPAQQALGFVPRWAVRQGLAETAAWYRTKRML